MTVAIAIFAGAALVVGVGLLVWAWRLRRVPQPIALPPADPVAETARRVLAETDHERELRQRDVAAAHAAVENKLAEEMQIDEPTGADLDRSVARWEDVKRRTRR